jgi:chromate reductase
MDFRPTLGGRWRRQALDTVWMTTRLNRIVIRLQRARSGEIAHRVRRAYKQTLTLLRTIMPIKKIAVIIGSLRKDSLNRKFANEVIALALPLLSLEIVEIGGLGLFNEDLEGNGVSTPAEWTQFREIVAPMDGVLFFTPEYNRSVPAVLKNAIDIGSRPYGASIWAGKPAAIISVSPGNLGGFGANHHLRQSIGFLDMPLLQQPEAYIGGAANLLGADGKLNDERTRQFLRLFVDAFAVWVETHGALSKMQERLIA